jgi:hypothetical protein
MPTWSRVRPEVWGHDNLPGFGVPWAAGVDLETKAIRGRW